ncbi:glycosyltransferase [Polluticoccus soli]|uniref:glycosyltransferase n=1 Tax=Polluticoccus soli TaxID=3034150 RepID=UPI0023E11CCC|nr:nucleotide disphospho-sugar-binding domain-containing protein [Flavipsychrobacter sp. JY13-12]
MRTTFDNTLEAITTMTADKKKKILFANIPADGHFNPLTGLAAHLKNEGHDVRWYTGPTYASKIEKLGIPYYLFAKAKEVTVHNIDEVIPERKKIKNHVKKVVLDICSYFIDRGTEFFEDIKDINQGFDFDVLIADNAFTGITFVKRILKKQVVTIGILPLGETSKELPPPIMGLTPAKSFAGKTFHAFLRYMTDNVLLKKPHELMHKYHAQYGVKLPKLNIFDVQIQHSTLYLQSGTPGFEYRRPQMSKNIHFIGPLMPYSSGKPYKLEFEEQIRKYDKLILVTQGTFEGDVTKLIIPTLDAFKGTNNLVVVTTAGWQTAELRERYLDYENIIIEDFIPFNAIMPYADVYVSNGGYGGVMLSINNKLPMVVGGVHEGKNEICARVGYFKLGVNLHTERPKPEKIRKAVEEVMRNNIYQRNVERLAVEFSKYDPLKICQKFIEELPAKAGK